MTVLLTAADVAGRLQVTPKTVYRWLAEGAIETVRLSAGGPVRVREQALERFIAARTTPAARRLRSTA